MQRRGTTGVGRAFIAAAAVGAGLAASGCNVLGPLFVAFSPPPSVKAEYTLDAKKSTIIFVDDRSNRLPRRSLRQTIAEEAQRVLLEKKTVDTVIDARAGVSAASADRSGEPLPIVEIGRAAKADVVIYVTIDSFTLSPDGSTYSPTATFRAKVLDAVEEKRLWPEEAAGFPVTLTPGQKNDYAPRGAADIAKAEIELAKRVGMAVGQLFAKHLAENSAVNGS